jgi:hypothetical protein
MLNGALRVAREVLAIRREHGISLATQWREYRRFARETGMVRGEFLRYWLWDVRRPLHERMAFISRRERVAAERRMNPLSAGVRVSEKVVATARLDAAGVPTADVLALISSNPQQPAGAVPYPVLRDAEGVRALLAEAPATGIVIKPVTGYGGASVHVFSAAGPDGLTALDGTTWPVERLLAVLAADATYWKVERRLPPHPVLERIAGPTLSTIRIVTFRMNDGTIHLGPATWKVPIDRSGLDHFMHGTGQYAAAIESATGLLGPARRWVSMVHTDHHPVTRERITGVTMPYWAAAVAIAKRATACFPEVWAPAYDIGITADGPVVIELNVKWAEELTQAPGPTGLVTGAFLDFLEERGCAGVVNLEARRRAERQARGAS